MTLFIGHTRYSLYIPRSESWRVSNVNDATGAEEYKRFLFNEDRLSLRDRIFTQQSVPALQRAAEGHNVKHVVSFSRSLPERFKESLRHTAAKYPVLVLDEQPDGGFGPPLHAIAREDLGGSGVYAEYRLDDDDILASNYFDRMDQYIQEPFVGMVVSFPKGIEAILSNSTVFNLRVANSPMNSMGLLHVCKIRDDGTFVKPAGGAHNTTDERNSVIIDSRDLGYFRYNHLGQDNILREGERADLAYLMRSMAQFPEFDDSQTLFDLFPTIAPLVSQDKIAPLITSPVRVFRPFKLNIPSGLNRVSFDFDIEFSPKTREYQALLSLDVIDSHGNEVTDLTMSGIAKSEKRTIGLYKYVQSGPGRMKFSEDVVLPLGYSLRSIHLRKFGRGSRSFLVHSAQARYVET